MPIFKVWAMDAEGANQTRFYDGDTSDAVIALARQRGLFPTKVKEVASAGNAPVERASSKLCCICGTDVSSEKRTKDTAGNYYCQPCYVSRSASNRSETTAKVSHAASSSGSSVSAAQCESCGGQTELSPDKRRARCKDCGRVSVIGAPPSSQQPSKAIAIDAHEAQPSEQELFTCPICNESFNRDGMDESGVCKRCHASKIDASTLQATKCCSCGAAIDEDAAFCARCGAKQDDRMSVQDEMDVSFIVAHVRRYAELCRDIARGEDAQKQFSDVGPRIASSGDNKEFADFLMAEEELNEHMAVWLAECKEVAAKLAPCDQTRVSSIVKLFFENDKVDEPLRNGLRRDVLGLFTATTPVPIPVRTATSAPRPSVTSPSQSKGRAKSGEFMNGISSSKKKGWTDNPRVVLAMGIVGTFVAVGLGLYASNGGGSSAGSAALVIGCFAVLGTASAIAEMRGKPWATQAEASTPSRRIAIGFCICITLSLVGCLLLLLAVSLVVTGGPPSADGLRSVLMIAAGGIVLLIVGGIGWSSACPKCHLIGTAEILSSENVGSHMETRKESRTARHFGRDGIEQSSTTYEADVPVQVTVHQHIKQCKKCGHIWSTTSRTES
jgi:hypothetical protein